MKNLRIETKKQGDVFFNFLPCHQISYTTKISEGSVEIVRKAMELLKNNYAYNEEE